MHFMRLSSPKGAHAALPGAAWQEIRVGMTKGAVALPSGIEWWLKELRGGAFRRRPTFIPWVAPKPI
jgi:hypothetical protein